MPDTIRAYRVESKDNGLVSSLNGRATLKLNDYETISISFVSEEHSQYYAEKHKNLVIKTWEMDRKLYDYIQSVINNRVDKKNHYHDEKLPRPSFSDGNVSKNAKKMALTFSKGKWIELLNEAVRGDLTVSPLEDEEYFVIANGEEMYKTKCHNFPDIFEIVKNTEDIDIDELCEYV